jgi:prolipoprotein diacylglyceryltransferase
MALLLIYENSKKRREGQVFALFFLLYAPLRFVLETTRGDSALLGLDEGALTPAQSSSLTLFVIALIGFVLISRRSGRLAQENSETESFS